MSRAGAGEAGDTAVETTARGEGGACRPSGRHRGYKGGGDKWRFKRNVCTRAASKLDVSKVRWIVREKAKGGTTNAEIAAVMIMTRRTAQYLWARFWHTRPEDAECPAHMDWQQDGLPGRAEHAAAVGLHAQWGEGTALLDARIKHKQGQHIPHDKI